MSKTAAAAAVGALLCDGKIKSLDDKAGAYSSFLKTIPHGDVSIKNILQMNSGVSPIGRSDEKRFNRKARGVAKFAGAADVRGALAFYKVAARTAGQEMNYHSSDTLALSVLVKDV
jgi:CubicO group peptidase (beta-lactamase class C family)